jgi:hypothetical protein
MFFNIAKQPQSNFSHFYELGPFCVSTDAGWSLASLEQYQVLYKGYVDTDSIESALKHIVQESEPQLLGNFCALVYNAETNSLKIKSDRYRGYPIWFDCDGVTNLDKKINTAWTDSLIEIKPDGCVVESKFDLIGDIDVTPVDLDHAVDYIHQRLIEKTQNFLKHNTRPIKTFLSGGVDSLLVYSYLQRFTNNFELVRSEHFDYDKFWLLNSGTVKDNFWGYKQLHHWTQPCVLTSGAPGDEFMLRSPTTTDLFLKFHGESAVDLLESDWKNCLHYQYFHQSKNYKIFQTQTVDATWDHKSLLWNLCNIVSNDWQHWHVGNTLTWTPLRDLEIFKMLIRLPATAALGQIMNSEISRLLIEKNKSGLSQLISSQKNSGNPLSNLCDFLL